MNKHDEFEKDLHAVEWCTQDEIANQKERNEFLAGLIVAFLACVAILAGSVLMGGVG
jgi:hypothetical protein